MEAFLQAAKNSSRILSTLSGRDKNRILKEMAQALRDNGTSLINANRLDMKDGTTNNLSSALMDRLFLDEKRIDAMAVAIEEIAALKEPVGRILEGWVTEDGLKMEKVSVPIGVIGIIYESRPNVTSDTAALCFKSSNVCVLKGGKEAENSNKAIAEILQNVLLENKLPTS
ncbi:MAG: gamma-glutamyl-phosphate reductase, partial [Campylobacterota bacterium]|nr:gamma-glutamyl-phosphate reductase [Campylobacterota bacterium]